MAGVETGDVRTSLITELQRQSSAREKVHNGQPVTILCPVSVKARLRSQKLRGWWRVLAPTVGLGGTPREPSLRAGRRTVGTTIGSSSPALANCRLRYSGSPRSEPTPRAQHRVCLTESDVRSNSTTADSRRLRAVGNHGSRRCWPLCRGVHAKVWDMTAK